MAIAPKLLAKDAPSATTLTDLYTVPGATSAVISTLFVCNRGGTDTTFRVSVAQAGAANDPEQYLYYDQTIRANSAFAITCGISLTATDVLRVYAGNANLSFNAFGIEET